MDRPFIEEAREDGQLLGWRIIYGDRCILIFAGQKQMPGFRLGSEFVPTLGKKVEYNRDGWRPIKTCTPAKGKIGAIVSDDGFVGEAYMERGHWYLPGDEQVRIYPTHWMPLPEPPK